MKRARIWEEKHIEVYTRKDREALTALGLCYWDTKPIDYEKPMDEAGDTNVAIRFLVGKKDMELIVEELLKRI